MLKKSLFFNPTNDGQEPNRETALHIAAREGNLEEIKLLIMSSRENPSMLNAEGKTAGQLAKDYGHKSLAQYLVVLDLCTQAKDYARRFFGRATSYEEIKPFRLEHRKLYDKEADLVERQFSSPTFLSQLDSDGSYAAVYNYTHFLIEINTAIRAAESVEQRTGLCGEVTRAAICFLIANFKEKDDSVSVEQLTSSSQANHTICVVGRSPLSDEHKSSNWGNAIACDFDHATRSHHISCCTSGHYPNGSFAFDWSRNHNGIIYGGKRPKLANGEVKDYFTTLWDRLIKKDAVQIMQERVKMPVLQQLPADNYHDLLESGVSTRTFCPIL